MLDFLLLCDSRQLTNKTRSDIFGAGVHTRKHFSHRKVKLSGLSNKLMRGKNFSITNAEESSLNLRLSVTKDNSRAVVLKLLVFSKSDTSNSLMMNNKSHEQLSAL